MGGTIDFEFYEGNAFNDWIINVTKDGSAFDLTGFDAHLHVVAFGDSDETLVIDISSDVDTAKIEVSDAAAGEITIDLTSAETDQAPGIYAYEVYVEDGGDPFTVRAGRFRILNSLAA